MLEPRQISSTTPPTLVTRGFLKVPKWKRGILFLSELAHTLWLTDKPTESKSIVRSIASPAQSECNTKTTPQSKIRLFFFPFFPPTTIWQPPSHDTVDYTPRIWLRGFTVLQSVQQNNQSEVLSSGCDRTAMAVSGYHRYFRSINPLNQYCK